MSERRHTAERTLHALCLGAWVRATRELAGLKQGEWAARVPCSQSHLSKLEAGRRLPNAYELNLLARAAGTDVAGLVSATQRVQQALLRAAEALVGEKEPQAALERLGEGAAATLALAAARTWGLPAQSKKGRAL